MTQDKQQPEDEAIPEHLGSSDAAFLADDEEEFSLEKLSQAYSKILAQNRAAAGIPEPESAEEEPESDEIDVLSDAADNAGVQITEHSIVEALLFVGVPEGEKLTAKRLATTLKDVSPKEIKKIVEDLNRRYQEEGSPYEITTEEGGYRMALRDSFATIRDQFYGEVREAQLNQFAIDTLSIVAYQQPVTRQEIERIRQRPSGALLNQLVERQLLRVDPETKGNDRRYSTTDRFLELFGLGAIQDLPLAQEVDDVSEFFDQVAGDADFPGIAGDLGQKDASDSESN